MNCTRLIPLAAILAFAGGVRAEIIPVTQGEIDNLGIRFDTPSPATEVAAAEVTARVTVPPAGEAVIAAPLPGLLTALNVDVGDSVDKGQVLADMMSPDFLELQREFLDLKQRLSKTMVLVTHDLEEAFRLADRIGGAGCDQQAPASGRIGPGG